jgi:hypothetical protein
MVFGIIAEGRWLPSEPAFGFAGIPNRVANSL